MWNMSGKNVDFDYEKMEKLLDHFSVISNVRYSLLDTDSHILCHTNVMTSFCTRMGAEGNGLSRCKTCDYNATQHVQASGATSYTYRCHAGLTETLIPIIMGGDIVGYICLGQYIHKPDREQCWSITRERLSQWHPNPDSFHDDFTKISIIEPDVIRAGVEILIACSAYICNECLFNRTPSTESDLLVNYLDHHFTQKIKLDDISWALGMSKTKLCSIAAYQGSTIQNMIQERRIFHAKKLLQSTVFSVSEVADQVGLSNYSYFTKVFRDVVGCTPSEYRRQYKGTTDEVNPLDRLL